MPTWTDDYDVTHDLSDAWARCDVAVVSRRRACVADEPARTVTCVTCAAVPAYLRTLQDLRNRDALLEIAKVAKLAAKVAKLAAALR